MKNKKAQVSLEAMKKTKFTKNRYIVLRQVITKEVANFLLNYLIMKRTVAALLHRNNGGEHGMAAIGTFKDEQVPGAYSLYGDPAFDTLMLMTSPIVEEHLYKKVIPQYTYARIYFKNSILEEHIDRPECEISVTISLGGEYNNLWPICIKDYEDNTNCIELDRGDAMIYYGRDLKHWRNNFNGVSQYQIFSHYVYADGKYKDRLFDGRRNIGLP